MQPKNLLCSEQGSYAFFKIIENTWILESFISSIWKSWKMVAFDL